MAVKALRVGESDRNRTCNVTTTFHLSRTECAIITLYHYSLLIHINMYINTSSYHQLPLYDRPFCNCLITSSLGILHFCNSRPRLPLALFYLINRPDIRCVKWWATQGSNLRPSGLVSEMRLELTTWRFPHSLSRFLDSILSWTPTFPIKLTQT